MSKESSSSQVQSLARGLEILRRLADSLDGLTVAELSAALDLKEPTTYKLVNTLVAAGVVEKTPRPVRYRLGSGLMDLADRYWERALRQRAETIVRALFEEFRLENANVVFTEAIGGEVEIVLRMSPERPGVLERPRGRTMSPYASACSLAFQAFWTDRERDDYQRLHPFWEQGEYLWETREKLAALLEETRRQGLATPRFPNRQIRLVAAPIFDQYQRLVAVLGLSLPEGTDVAAARWKQIVQRVARAARELSSPPQAEEVPDAHR